MIEVHIPYDHTGGENLGRECNRIMENARYDNVLFVDHDVYLKLNPNWYQMCLEVVKGLEFVPWGWITCWTNRIGCRWQKLRGVKDTDDLRYHKDVARKVYEKWPRQVYEIWPLRNYEAGLLTDIPSAFFMLTNKKAWAAVGGYPEGMFQGTETKYGFDIAAKGYYFYRIDGLYVYHSYDREHSW